MNTLVEQPRSLLVITIFVCAVSLQEFSRADVVVGNIDLSCRDDPACFNRLHPEIEKITLAKPGERIVFIGRDNVGRNPKELKRALANPGKMLEEFESQIGLIHGLTGPVEIEGAIAGDVLAVTIERIEPGPLGFTHVSPWGFAGDLIDGEQLVVWNLSSEIATSEDIPGVRIPNASFPGTITTLPGKEELQEILEREQQLAETGAWVFVPDPELADPIGLCGPEGTRREECVRTIPPREFHGGNLDIRYLGVGTTIYLPCNVDGCGLAAGDFHYAQGDGEIAGTGIEMTANMTVTTRLIRDGPDLSYGPHYEGASRTLAIPSETFYAVTGFPIKERGTVPRELEYLNSETIGNLANLHLDSNLAARNAVASMLQYITEKHGYNRLQAYAIVGLAADLRIAQIVDVPNVTVTAILPLDIFEPQ